MSDTAPCPIAQRRSDILARLARAASPPPTLVAVSKRQPEAVIEAALAAGQRVFGENRFQEAQAHWADRIAKFDDLCLHLIGPLQTNKALAAIKLFDVIETLDRNKLARALAEAITKTGRSPEVFIQVNTGEEPQKAGVFPEKLPELLSYATADCALKITGLMCIPPVAEPAGPHFALLAKLARRHGLSFLSMGMSNDYELAAKFGATHVRIGSALFGPREN